MISLVLPLPVSVERYWRVFVPRGGRIPRVSVTREGRMYQERVRDAVRQAGVHAPLSERVALFCVVYPNRPEGWQALFRRDPAGWDDAVFCEGLDGMMRVLTDVLRGVVFESDRRVRRFEVERAVPDGHGRVEVRVETLAGEWEARPAVPEVHEVRHGVMPAYVPGMIVATPSGRQAVVLRCLRGTGKDDMFERVICRYLDSTSERESVTLQPRFLRPIA